ncbi:MAG TPA: class I SAM-dependent rRNA methyltransferase [Rhizomicrobium sp.]|jgi:23S rRNA (cytosine1962-C5)-methyltransferase|nr:class I SAM-dependent rRNA methyltransferase [Rhizomicrobium sp.]
MPSHPAIRLKPREGRRALAGGPWIFSNEIVMDAAAKSLAPGSLVNAQMADRRPLGTGYFNPKSLIAVRLLDSAPDAEIGDAFFASHFARALARRAALFEEHYYRLVHAEGDGLPGLTIDRFGDTCVAQVTTAGMEALTEAMLGALDEVIAPKHVVLRNDAPLRALEGLEQYVRTARGELPSRIAVVENGVRYFADPDSGQKTGWYFDQRDNRAFMAKLANGRTVLDCHCYTGGFAILAAKSGATEIVGIDSSAPALALAGDAANANGVAGKCKFVKADVFEELERLARLGQTFDVVIADPPPFVKARKDLEAGARAYRKVARLAASVTAANGYLLLASCSHNMPRDRFEQECAIGIARAGRRGALIRDAGAGPDHPVHPMLPETAYLKALVYALD